MSRPPVLRPKVLPHALAALVLAVVAVVGVVAVLLMANGGVPSPSATPLSTTVAATAPASAPGVDATPTGAPAVTAGSLATDVLAELPVKGRAPKTGYDRVADFGTAWLDVDHNGCDTRNDILARDLSPFERSGHCKVVSGTLHDPYTSTTIDFVRGVATSRAVQIDHVVALMNAWETGAQLISQAERVSLANDPLNLFAVDGPTNARKGAGDAATWLPPNRAFRCEYVARQISVKRTYGLWVTSPEKDAMARVLSSCPDQRAYSSSVAP